MREFSDTEQGLEGHTLGGVAHVADDLGSGFAFVISIPGHDLYGDDLNSFSSESAHIHSGC